jgi:hypothetical protein
MATLLRVKELQEYYIEQTKIGNTLDSSSKCNFAGWKRRQAEVG